MNNVRVNAPARVLSIILIISAVLLFRYQPNLGIVPPWLLSAQQWEKAVVLRLGKLHAIRGPGLFVVIPIVDTVTVWIDQRIQTTEFNAEQALTRDTVPAKDR